MVRGPGRLRRSQMSGHNDGCLCCAPPPTERSAWKFDPSGLDAAKAADDEGDSDST